jgi:low affinity Fe/Cu permease
MRSMSMIVGCRRELSISHGRDDVLGMAMPSQVDEHLSIFDRFADAAVRFTSQAPFFAACVALVALWAPSYFLTRDLDTWQLIINTTTTIITFLMVALIQNSQTRADKALQHKLNAIAEALADLMESNEHLDRDQAELRAAVGLEDRESSRD